MRRAKGGLVANERAMLDLLADTWPSWSTTGDLLRLAHERHAAGRWVTRQLLRDGRVISVQASARPVNEATVYRILERFAQAGWVQASWWVPDDPWSKDRPLRIVVLTDAGRAKADELAVRERSGS